LSQVNTGLNTAEKAIAKLSGEESKEANFDMARHISMAKSSVSSAQKCIEGHLKSRALEASDLTMQKQKVEKFDKELAAAEESHKSVQKAKLEKLKGSYVTELTKHVTEFEKLVDVTKDAAVLFTCEMAEHIKPEETMEAKEKTDAAATPAQDALKKAKDFINSQ